VQDSQKGAFEPVQAPAVGPGGVFAMKQKGARGLMGAGFHDMMIEVDNDPVFSDAKQAEMGNFLIRLGYDAVAYNVSATAPLSQHHRCVQRCAPRGSTLSRACGAPWDQCPVCFRMPRIDERECVRFCATDAKSR
jgi:hypothetical protein